MTELVTKPANPAAAEPPTARHGGGRARRTSRPLRALRNKKPRPPGRAAHQAKVARQESFNLGDLMSEAVRGLAGHPGRLALTTLAVVLGIGALVATVGFAQTGSRQLEAAFDAAAATFGVVKPTEDQGTQMGGPTRSALPWNGDETLARLNGVEAAGLVSEIQLDGLTITAAPVNDPMAPPARQPSIAAATPGAAAAIGATVSQGRWFTEFHEQQTQAVAVLGAKAAALLGVTRVDNAPSVFIGAKAYTVIGLLDHSERALGLLNAVIVPQSTARQTLGLDQPGELWAKLALGAGPIIAKQAALALNPSNPSGFTITMPPPPSELRKQVAADVNSLFIILGLVALAIGGVVIAVVTTLTVMERKGEIGLRRAIGATRGQIAAQFVTETAIVGLLGGLIGAAVGVATVVATAVGNHWTPVLDLRLVGAAGLVGTLIGTTAGFAPAIRAAKLEPAAALQEGT